MDAEKIRELAAKLLQGIATDKEKRILHDWYDSKKIPTGEELRIPETSPKDRIYQKLVNQFPKHSGNAHKKSTRSIPKLIWPAATILIMVVSYIVFNFMSIQKSVEWITVDVPFGEMEKVVLPDKSIVWINAGSQFRYPAQFIEGERHVELNNGQAFFDVRKNEEWPFKVCARDLQVSVKGTSFEVKNFVDEEIAIVGVKSGQVNIKNQNHNKILPLYPGDIASVNQFSGTMDKWTRDPKYIGSWIENRLVYDGELLGVVTNALERKFDVNIIAEESGLFKLPVTIKLNDQPLEDILTVLGYTLDFKFVMEENKKKIILFKE